MSTTQQKSLLDDKLETFNRAFNCSNGSGSRELITAAYYARDLGANLEYITELMWEISNYWDYPLSEERIENTILTQINRWF